MTNSERLALALARGADVEPVRDKPKDTEEQKVQVKKLIRPAMGLADDVVMLALKR